MQGSVYDRKGGVTMVAMESCKKAVPGKNCQYLKEESMLFLEFGPL